MNFNRILCYAIDNMKWSFSLFISISVAVLVLLGVLGYFSEKTNLYKPSLEQYTSDTDHLKEVCNQFLAEHDPAAMNKRAMTYQMSKSISCTEYNGECKAFHDFLSSAVYVSSDNKFSEGAELTFRGKYEDLIHAIEDGKMKLKK
ncbi:MAG: hypothetical protein ACXVAX_03230 [Pseudobdellovibrio sp.]